MSAANMTYNMNNEHNTARNTPPIIIVTPPPSRSSAQLFLSHDNLSSQSMSKLKRQNAHPLSAHPIEQRRHRSEILVAGLRKIFTERQ